MDLYDWLLFLHVLGAFFAVGGLTALWALILGTRGATPLFDPPSTLAFGRVAGILVGVGLMAALIFGIWLAIDLDAYQLWDGWILASLVLWMFGGWAGGKSGKAFESNDRTAGIRFQAINSVAVLVILVLMIWKPGA